MQNENEVLERSGSRIALQRTNPRLGKSPKNPESQTLNDPTEHGGASESLLSDCSNKNSKNLEFSSDQTHGFSQADFTDVAVSSDGLGWTSAFVSRQTENPYQRSFKACSDPLISFVLNGPLSIWRMVNGVSRKRKFLPGNFGIIPAGAAFDAKADVPLETIHIYVRQEIIEEVASDLIKGDPTKLGIVPQFAAFDPLLEQLAAAVCQTAQEPALSSSLYVDHLGRAFAARLVKKHSTATTRPSYSTQDLSQRQLDWVAEFVEANLAAQLSLADLAQDSGLSPNHFAKLFKNSAGITPYQFLMRRRIDRAQRLLAATNAPISDIAVQCGFGNQMHLTQAFRRLTGVTPALYRKEHRS